MLVIGRKEQEAFTLILPNGDEVEVMFEKWSKGEAKISVDAPDDVLILRNELLM